MAADDSFAPNRAAEVAILAGQGSGVEGNRADNSNLRPAAEYRRVAGYHSDNKQKLGVGD